VDDIEARDNRPPGAETERPSTTCRYRRLGFTDAQLYAEMTYPIYRPRLRLLDAGEQSPVTAVGASLQGMPAGLALAELPEDDGGTAELLSVYTHPEHRRRGVATGMLDRMEGLLRRGGCGALRAVFEQGRPMTEAVHSLLRRRGFPPVRTRALIGRCSKSGIAKAPWLHEHLVPKAFGVFLWKDLPEGEKAALRESQEREPWFPEQLSPFQDEAVIEPLNSLGLRYRGEIVGWMITHRTARDTIRYTAIFVRKDFQDFGLAIPLLIESIRRQIETGGDPAEGDPAEKATFVVHEPMRAMARFVRRHMAPYVDSLNDSVETIRVL